MEAPQKDSDDVEELSLTEAELLDLFRQISQSELLHPKTFRIRVRNWSGTIRESLIPFQESLKRNVIFDEEGIIVSEIETRYQSRAAGTFLMLFIDTVLKARVPRTEFWDTGLILDMSGKVSEGDFSGNPDIAITSRNRANSNVPVLIGEVGFTDSLTYTRQRVREWLSRFDGRIPIGLAISIEKQGRQFASIFVENWQWAPGSPSCPVCIETFDLLSDTGYTGTLSLPMAALFETRPNCLLPHPDGALLNIPLRRIKDILDETILHGD